MTAGLNIKVRFWGIVPQTDDDVGGAVISGSIIYDGVPARLEPVRPDMLLLQQGIEVTKLFTCITRPPNMGVQEVDEVEVVFPANHKELGKRMKVKGVQDSSLHPSDSRGYLILVVERSDYAHTISRG